MNLAPAKSDRLVYRILIIGIIALSVVLHFWNLKNLSLSNDELSSIMRARHSSFLEMIRQGVYTDYHPAGTHIWFFFYNQIFGEDALIIRLPFVLISFLSAWLLYLIGRRCFGELSGLLAAAAFTISSLCLQYTQISRMYSPGIFFSILTVYAWLNYVFPNDNHQRRWWWLWVLSMIACLHLHYFAFVFAAGVGVSGMFFIDKKNRWKYILGGIIALLTFVPELPIFREQMKTGDIGGWLSAPDKMFLVRFFYQVFNESFLLIGFVLMLFVFGIFFGKKMPDQWRWRIVFVLWFLLVFVLAYGYSVLAHPVIQFSTILFPLPFIFLVLFSFSFGERKWLNAIIVVAFLAVGVVTLIRDGVYTKNHYGVFRELTVDVSHFPAQTPVVVNVVNPDYFEYYIVRMPELDQKLIYRVIKREEIARLIQQVDTSTSEHFGFAWTNEFHPWEILEIIRDKYPYLQKKHLYFNSAAYLFSKSGTEKGDDLLYNASLDYEDSGNGDPHRISTDHYSGTSSEQINAEVEFSGSLQKKISDLPLPQFGYFIASVYFKADHDISDVLLVLSVEKDGESLLYEAADLSKFYHLPESWSRAVLSAEITKPIPPGAELKVYIWNRKKESLLIDDLTLKVYRADNPYAK